MAKGKRTPRPASLLDIYPTLVDLSGGKISKHLNGKSLVSWLRNPNADFKTPAITTHGPGNHAVQSEYWRYIRYANGSEELYDHRKDPNEFTNLAGQSKYGSIVDEHASSLPKAEVSLDPAYKVPEKYQTPKR